MNKRQKQRVTKLVAALRSGRYNRGTGQLGYTSAVGNQYNCCLGVACEVAGVVGAHPENGAGIDLIYEGEIGVLPKRIMEYYGFKEPDPHLDDGDEEIRAASIFNDEYENITFENIADMFEYTYLNGPKPKRIQGND